jgi:hypothetical protein
MPTINKVSFATVRTPSFHGNQPQNVSIPIMPKLGLKQDIISFSGKQSEYVSDDVMDELKKAEKEPERVQKEFFKELRELCEFPTPDKSGNVDAGSQLLKGDDKKRALGLYDLIENDPGTDQYLKKVIKRLRPRVGLAKK